MRISVITVCLNSVKTIERTIKSVIKQSYDELEYIVVDGGSSDGTVEIIKRYEDYIACWISEKDHGLYDAMNKGIAKSTGEIIAFLNSDDWYEEDTLMKVRRYYEKRDPMILIGQVNMLKKGKWTKYTNILDNDKENLRMAMIYRQPAAFARREVFDRFGGFQIRYKIAADFDWMLRMYDSGVQIMCVEDVFTNFSSTGISNTDVDCTIKEAREIALGALERCEKYSVQEKETWKRKINECYDEQQATTDVTRIIRRQQIADYPKLKLAMLDYFTERSYVVWGIGNIGDDVYHLLSQLGLEVDFFIDRKADGVTCFFHDREVLAPQKLAHGKKVIASSFEYEDEIADQLEKMGYQQEKDYILYSKIFLKLVETYMEWYLMLKNG